MNYEIHYRRLIKRAKGRSLQEYTEKHHIIPKCLGGSNFYDNLVALTAREHFVAHQLLCKIHPNNKKLVYALYMMTLSTSQTIRNNKEYGWIRQQYSKNHHARGKPAHNKGISASARTKTKMSVSKKLYWEEHPNMPAPNRGISHTDETKEKIKYLSKIDM